MDPVTLIVGALAAGALRGAGETSSTAVKDAYAALKAAIAARFADRQVPSGVLAEHEDDPETYEKPLTKRIQQADAGQVPRIVELAQELMRLMDVDGVRTRRYTVDVRGAQGVQIGGRVDPITIVSAALQAGASTGSRSDSRAVAETYRKLVAEVRHRFKNDDSVLASLDALQRDPIDQDIPLLRALSNAGMDWSEPAVELAQQLIALLETQGAGKYSVDLRGAQGIQLGDHNTQTNTFS